MGVITPHLSALLGSACPYLPAQLDGAQAKLYAAITGGTVTSGYGTVYTHRNGTACPAGGNLTR